VLDAAEHGAEDGQQTRPGIPAALENLLGFLAQLHAQGRERVVGLVAFVAQEQQATLFGGEQEHQPHHHRQRGFVEFRFLHVTQQLAIAVLVGLVERLDQHFDGAAHLLAEGVGDFVLELQRAVEQRRQLLGFIDEEATNAEQMHEGLQGDGFLAPDAGVPTGEGGDGAHRGIDQHPALAVGHQPEAAPCGAAQLNHAVGGGGGPAIQLQSDIEVDILNIGVDEHQRLVGALLVDDRHIRGQRHAMFGQGGIQVGRTPVGALQNVAFAVLIEFQPTRQHLVDPGSVHSANCGSSVSSASRHSS
jgi:hypothetical protein